MNMNNLAFSGYSGIDNQENKGGDDNVVKTSENVIHLLQEDNEYLDVKYSLCEEIKKFINNGEEIEKKDLDFLNKGIDFIFSKYRGKLRKNGETVITHLVRTSLFTIRNFKNPSLIKTITALLHDVVEDGYSSFEEIKENFGEKIALMVLGLSKDRNLIEKEEYRIKIDIQGTDFAKNKKVVTNEEYFNRYESVETMSSYLEDFIKENDINIDGLNIKEMVLIIFDVKLADRCHNLCTQWDPHGIKKIFKKINETFYYITPIAEKYNREALRILLLLIGELYSLDVKVNGEIVGRLAHINWKNIKEELEIDFGKRNIINKYNNYHGSLKENMLKTTI